MVTLSQFLKLLIQSRNNIMKKSDLDLLYHPQSIDPSHPIFQNPPKTPQQYFLFTSLALQLIAKNQQVPNIKTLISPSNGSFSQLLLRLKYTKYCIDRKQELQNPNLLVLNLLIQWMEELQKIKEMQKPSLFHSLLLPYPNQLALNHEQELVFYFNYVSKDLQQLLKNAKDLQADDLLALLEVMLPRVYYNIILPVEVTNGQGNPGKVHDVLYFNQSVQYFTRTKIGFRTLCKAVLKYLLTISLKQSQMRQIMERACRYYLLFRDDKQSIQLFLSAFDKTSEAAKISLSDELVLFFKVLNKLGDTQLQPLIRQKNSEIQGLLLKFGSDAVVGHPKDQLNPFHPLGIRQTVRVDSGKITSRIFQIYQQYSLFYFKLLIQNHDVTLRLFYLGDFQSKTEIKKLLVTQEKVSIEVRSAFMATKRGIYMIEFDNSYSWINGKNLRLEYVVLTRNGAHQKWPYWLNKMLQLQNNNKKDAKTQNASDTSQIKQVQAKSQKLQNKQKQLNNQGEKESQTIAEQQVLEQDDTNIQNKNEQVIKKEQIQIKQYKEEEYIEENHINDLPEDTPQLGLLQVIEKKQQDLEKHTITAPNIIYSQPQPQPIIEPELKISSSSDLNNLLPQPNSSSLIDSSQKIETGQGNLSLIDNIFSLLVNIQDHTYEFQTNLQDRIFKRIKSYCESPQKLHWIFNSQARDWLRKHGFSITNKGGKSLLLFAQKNLKSTLV